MFGNNKKFNALNGRIDGIVKGATIAFAVKTTVDVIHGVVTAKNTFDINRLNRMAAGVPTDKDVQKFADIKAKWAAKAAAAPVTPADDTAAAPVTPPTDDTAEAPVTPPADDADKDKADEIN